MRRMGEYKQNMLNESSGYYLEIEQFTLKNKLQPLIQIDGDVTDLQLITTPMGNIQTAPYGY